MKSIEEIAYELWENRGRPLGEDWADWFAAEARVRGRTLPVVRRKEMKTALILGAGASAAEGAPVQSNLFYEYFKTARRRGVVSEMDTELATFFDMMFGIDVDDKKNLRAALFPTFEEALGILDLAERRKESLKDFDLENMATNSNRIRFVRQYLVMLMAKVLHDKLAGSGAKHRTLASKLHEAGRIRDTIFITTNYDILIDNALTSLYTDGVSLDYGIDSRTLTSVATGRDPTNLRSSCTRFTAR
jgi:hypothetical protein